MRDIKEETPEFGGNSGVLGRKGMERKMPLGFISSILDNGLRTSLPKPYTALLGFASTTLLMYLCNSLENRMRTEEHEDGFLWHKQAGPFASFHTTLSLFRLRNAAKELRRLGLIVTKQLNDTDRTFYWRIEEEALLHFHEFAFVWYRAMSPANLQTFPEWEKWTKENPSSYAHWVSQINPKMPVLVCPKNRKKTVTYDTQSPETPVKCHGEVFEACKVKKSPFVFKSIKDKVDNLELRSSEPGGSEGDFISSSVEIGSEEIKKLEEQNATQRNRRCIVPPSNKPKKKTPPLRPCPFVEHWNNQPNVPKCKLGSKSYEESRRMFEAHRQNKLGLVSPWTLNHAERDRIDLDEINRPGKIRTEEDMFKHIETAAMAYDPDYSPINKQYLPRSLPAFLYNAFSRKYGQVSYFLAFLKVQKPQPIDTETKDQILYKATEEECDSLDILRKMYKRANGRSETERMTLDDVRRGLDIVRNIKREWKALCFSRSAVLHHFGDFRDFRSWWQRFCGENLFDFMPISSFATNKNLWRKFVNFVSSDLGVDIYTGVRI